MHFVFFPLVSSLVSVSNATRALHSHPGAKGLTNVWVPFVFGRDIGLLDWRGNWDQDKPKGIDGYFQSPFILYS